ncbi:MAG TPA: GNAT family N-acetyltransferase [Gaiellales bacterium]
MPGPAAIVQPETPLERAICADPAWRAGVVWGEPRSGHPEGTVIAHIGDVLRNVDRVAIDPADRERLRLAAIVHDAFKRDVDRSLPKTGENHHAMRARRFAEGYLNDPDLLDVIELHDEAYLAWRGGRPDGDWAGAELRARALLDRLGGHYDLFARFYRADNETDGKTDEHRHWLADLRDGLRLETGRLILVAARAEPLRALRDGDVRRAGGILGAAVPDGWPDVELAEILPDQLERLEAEPATLGFGVWVIVAAKPRIVVGSAGFIAPPDDGEVELGYGVHPDHRGIGYATEAAKALVRWSLAQDGVRRVIAECDDDNGASIRVLEKAGMRRVHTRAGLIRWELTADGAPKGV